MPRLEGENNILLTDDVIAKEAMRLLKNELIATRFVHRDHEQRFGTIGDTISIKKPARIKSASGRNLVKQPMVDQTVALKIDNQEHVGLEFTATDRALALPDFSERYLRSGISQLAHALDLSVLTTAKNGFYNSTGTPGVAPTTDQFIDAHADQVMLGHPDDGMTNNILNPKDAASVRKELKTLYNPSMVQTAIERATCGPLAGDESYETAQMIAHVVGDHGGTPLVAGAGQIGGTLNIDGGSASTTGFLAVGDVFTIAGVNSVNPRTYQDTGEPQFFTVEAAVDTDGAGAATLVISPAINDGSATGVDKEGNSISLRAYQNVTALPADNAPLTIWGTANTTYKQNLQMHKDAVALAVVDFPLPETAALKSRVRDEDTGLSMLMTGAYDINNMNSVYRVDILWGVKAVYPELGRRIWGA